MPAFPIKGNGVQSCDRRYTCRFHALRANSKIMNHFVVKCLFRFLFRRSHLASWSKFFSARSNLRISEDFALSVSQSGSAYKQLLRSFFITSSADCFFVVGWLQLRSNRHRINITAIQDRYWRHLYGESHCYQIPSTSDRRISHRVDRARQLSGVLDQI